MSAKSTTTSDLHVYGANCMWHGPISSAGSTGPGIPCCPHCEGVLFQTPEHKWWDGASTYEKAGHANYVDFLLWVEKQPKCWKSIEDAAVEYKTATGKEVKL